MQCSRRSASITTLALLLGIAGCGGGKSTPDAGPAAPGPAPAPAQPLESDGVLTTLARFGVDLDPSLVVDGQGTAYVSIGSALVAVDKLGGRRVVSNFVWDPDGVDVTGLCGNFLRGLSPGPGGVVMFTMTDCSYSSVVASFTPAGEFVGWDSDYEAGRGSGVAVDAEGSVYVTGGDGDDRKTGSVLRLDGPRERAWRVWFGEANGLAWPQSPLTAGPDGWVYGVAQTYGGPDFRRPYNNVLFRISRAGVLQTLFTLPPGEYLGASLQPDLLVGNDGWITGMASAGGVNGLGTVWRMRIGGGGVELLHDVVEAPSGPLLRGADGHLYGTKPAGGAEGRGVLFRLTANGTYDVLYSFKAAAGPPQGPLFQPADGLLYGTTARTVFRIALPD